MQTVQCKNIEPVNTNIHITTHTSSRLQEATTKNVSHLAMSWHASKWNGLTMSIPLR